MLYASSFSQEQVFRKSMALRNLATECKVLKLISEVIVLLKMYCGRDLMSLCLIPLDKIREEFYALKAKCTIPKLLEFAEYVRKTWIETNCWPP